MVQYRRLLAHLLAGVSAVAGGAGALRALQRGAAVLGLGVHVRGRRPRQRGLAAETTRNKEARNILICTFA